MTRILFKLIYKVLAVCAFLVMTPACREGEPKPAENIEIPAGARDEFDSEEPADDNSESPGEENPEEEGNEGTDSGQDSDKNDNQEVDLLAGTWADKEREIIITFNKDSSFTTTGGGKLGFYTTESEYAEGFYSYDSMYQYLYLSVQGNNDTVYQKKYKCVIDNREMKITTFDNKKITLWKE